MTAPALTRPTDEVMAALLADVKAKQVQEHHRRDGLDVAYFEAWIRQGPRRWQITAAGRTELARLTGKQCQVCGQPSLSPECTKCGIAEETAWKRHSDV